VGAFSYDKDYLGGINMLKVALSPFFGGTEYTDEVSGLTFENRKDGSIAIYDVTKELDLSGIRKAIRLNVLLLVEGGLPKEDVAPIAEVEKAEEKVEETKSEVAEEVVEEVTEEVKEVKTAKKGKK
jgi:hypothetical protein